MEQINLAQYIAKKDKKTKVQQDLKQHTEQVIQGAETLEALGYLQDQRMSQLLKIACKYHDLGKMNPVFQNRIKDGGRFNAKVELGHNILSVCLLDKKEFPNGVDYYLVANAVLHHHHFSDNLDRLADEKSQALSRSLLKDFDYFPINARGISKLADIREQDEAILLTGLLHKCDYSASAGITIEQRSDFLMTGLAQLQQKWQVSDPRSGWNGLQQFCQTHQGDNLVITAPTGMGKTEAGLLWIGDHKGFFVLPLKTAINAIYRRVVDDIICHEQVDQRVALLHGDSQSYYSKHPEEDMDALDYYNKTKHLSIPLTIATPDQLFDFVFKYPGYELKLATLAYAKVVIDEIQAYSADLLAYLIYGLKRTSDLGGQFAILTATLPPFITDLLAEKTAFVRQDFVNETKLPIRHHLKTYQESLNSQFILEQFQSNQHRSSNKILVVCNTVKKAQQIYEELKNAGVSKVCLLHSKFIKKHRALKETAIIAAGETYSDQDKKILNNGSVIWIATQIVEASLDIDFDYLITELSDLNGLFQRMGRCNRKGVKLIDEPNCFVFTSINPRILNYGGQKGFIDGTIYDLSKQAIESVGEGPLSEQVKQQLINTFLTTEKLNQGQSHFLTDYKKYYRYVESLYLDEKTKQQVAKEFRNIVAYDVIPKVIYELCQEDIKNQLAILRLDSEGLSEDKQRAFRKAKIEAKNDIMQYTVSVGHYDIYAKKGNAITETIDLNQYQQIFVIDGEYDDEIGFQRSNIQDKDEQDNVYDSFI